MTKTVRERIEDLNRRAYALASRIAGSAMDSGCTDIRPTGPRQSKAWDMIAEAYGWNAISDNAEALKAAEELERDGTSYRIEYGSAGFQVVLVEEPKPEETIVKRQPEAPADDRCSTCHRDAHRPGMGGYGVHGHPYTPPKAAPRAAGPEHQLGGAVTTPAGLGTVTGFDGSSVLVTVDGFEYSVSADKVHATTKADPEPRRYGAGEGFTIEQARDAMGKVGAELQANAGYLAEVLDAAEASQPEHTGEYYVMPHGFTAPASRPAARFPYVGVEAGDAFDQALTWAREYVRTSFDVWHADAGRSTFIVQVMADGRLVWPHH